MPLALERAEGQPALVFAVFLAAGQGAEQAGQEAVARLVALPEEVRPEPVPQQGYQGPIQERGVRLRQDRD